MAKHPWRKAAGLENLRGQIVERDQTIQRNEVELKEKQRHLDVAVAEIAVMSRDQGVDHPGGSPGRAAYPA